jgi:hypothetical protein
VDEAYTQQGRAHIRRLHYCRFWVFFGRGFPNRPGSAARPPPNHGPASGQARSLRISPSRSTACRRDPRRPASPPYPSPQLLSPPSPPPSPDPLACFFLKRKGLSLAAKQRSAPSKKARDVLPLTAEERTATQQLPSCCRGRSRPSRRHQSRTSLTQQSQSTGRRRRGGAAECAQKFKRPRRALLAPCARTQFESRASSARATAKAAASIASDGGEAVLTAERPGLFDIAVLFPLVSLPVAVAPTPPPPPPRPLPCLLCIKRPRLLPSLGPSTSTTTARPWWARSA